MWTQRTDYLYVLPAFVVLMIVIAYPVYYTIDLSFFQTPSSLQLRDKIFNGLDNYVTILTSAVFWKVTWNTIIWTVASTVIAFALGFGCALALHRAFIGRGFLRALLLIPWVVSAVAASYVWRWIYHSDFGVIGAALVQLGLADRPPNFIDNIHTVLPSLIVVNIWREFSFAMIMLMAGLQTVPDQLLRAAQVDGANTWNRFWHVTFPHLRGVSTVTVLLLAVANFNSFIIPWVDDRRRAVQRLAHLDHAHLRARLRPPALGRRRGLLGAALHHPDDARRILRPRADQGRQREAGRMTAIATEHRHVRMRRAAESPSTGGAGRAGSSSSS